MRVFLLEGHPWGAFPRGTTRPRGLPGVDCPREGPWAMIGEEYPLAAVPGNLSGYDMTRLWPVGLEEMATLRELVRPYVPAGSPLYPGTRFGPLGGRSASRLPPFVDAQWCPLVRQDLAEALLARVPGLLLAPSEIRHRGPLVMLELVAPLLASHGPTSLPIGSFPACPLCGRRGIKTPAVHTLRRASVPVGMPVFRSKDITAVFVTDVFREAGLANGLREEWFTEVELE